MKASAKIQSVVVLTTFFVTAGSGCFPQRSEEVDAGAIDYDYQLTWMVNGGGNLNDVGYGVAALPCGPIWIAGTTKGAAVFGSGADETTWGTTSTDDSEDYDAYVAQYDIDGRLDWIRGPTDGATSGNDLFLDVAAFSDGSAVAIGWFADELTFGAGSSDETVRVSAGDYDVLLARYSHSGDLSWVTSAGGAGRDLGAAVASIPDGSILATGSFEDEATFGEGTAEEQILASAGKSDAFLARYSADGKLVWIRQVSGTEELSGWAIAAWPDGSVVVAGGCNGAAEFGEGGQDQTGIICSSHSAFFAKYAADGTFEWAKTIQSTLFATISGLAVFQDGTIAAAGRYHGHTVFGPGEPNQIELYVDPLSCSCTNNDGFVARFEADGSLGWLAPLTGSCEQEAYDVVASEDGAALVTGRFGRTALFASPAGNHREMTAWGDEYDVFLARYERDGRISALEQAGTGRNTGRGVAVLADGSALLTGTFWIQLNFSTNGNALVSHGGDDVFLARMTL
jgi:hypothetical protein